MPHGKICYVEIPADVPEDAADFYRDVFGWKVRPRGDGELAFDDGGGVGGTWVRESHRTKDEPVRIYVQVDSVDSSLAAIAAKGGKVLQGRTEIAGGLGAFGIFRDPVGNEFGVYEEPKG